MLCKYDDKIPRISSPQHTQSVWSAEPHPQPRSDQDQHRGVREDEDRLHQGGGGDPQHWSKLVNSSYKLKHPYISLYIKLPMFSKSVHFTVIGCF